MTGETEFRGACALVTGASGFIGSQLSRRLLQLGASVHGVSRFSQPAEPAGVAWTRADIADGDAVRALVRALRPDYVFHLAGHVTSSVGLEHVAPTFSTILASTVHLLTAVAGTGCRRFVAVGSLNEPEGDASEALPTAPYAAAKWASAAYGRMFHALYGVPVVTARSFMVYGPEQKDLAKLIPYVALALLRGESPKVSSGGRLIDWLFIDDLVDGLLLLAAAPGVEGATLEFGSGALTSIRDIVERIERLVGASGATQFGAVSDRPLEPTRIAAIAETARRIGWTPQTNLDDGLASTVAWCRRMVEAETAAMPLRQRPMPA